MKPKRIPTAAKLGFAAAALGAAALFNRKKVREAEADLPPIGKFVEVDGVRLHYLERGDGAPLVMLHGMGALVQDFLGSGLIDRAAERYRVIAFDRPGYGYSDRPRGQLWTPQAQAALIHAALVKLRIEKPVVLGHSWGTLPALALALDYPDDVSGLVLLAGYYFPSLRPDPLLLAGPSLPLIGPLLSNTLSPLLGRATRPAVFRQIFAPSPVPENFKSLFPTELALRPKHIQAAAGDAGQLQLGAMQLSKRYGELTMPVAIAAGDGDKVVAFDQAERLHAAIPHSSLHRAEGAGHMIHWIDLDVVTDAIEAVQAARASS
jgi:pimeloyl-ACP methyl ester carboxylesterase